ncbi:MAG: hypothetical protein ACXWQZ_23700 [Ktedonobacterales bacterium]
MDATGLARGANSACFVNRVRDQGQGRTWRHWLDWVIVADLPRQLMLAQMAPPGPCTDKALPPALLQHACHHATIRCVLADAECASERTHRFMRQDLGALSVIPATRGKATWHLHGIRAQMRAAFPRQRHRQRAGAEALFSTTKRKLSARASGRSPAMPQRQALVLGVTDNLYRLRFLRFLLLYL